MKDISILIGGKAGDGIDKSGLIIAKILAQLGYKIYVYRDYPSIIRGGHTFSIIRASTNKIATHINKVDFILALNQDCVNLHADKYNPDTIMIYNSDIIKQEILPKNIRSIAVPLESILKEENAPPVMRNSCAIAAFCKISGIQWDIFEKVLKTNINREIDLNLKVAQRGYDSLHAIAKLDRLTENPLAALTGNEAIGLGLIKGGLETYIAYPMTPSSPILHFLADLALDFDLKVIHPENEIAVTLMALGFSYTGNKVAVGTSGGGFCLMTEGLSFSGMAELPIVFVLGQRPGPSTGLPTHTAQTELHFALNAGQGEFPRFLVAPGDAEEAYFWATTAMHLAWKYQIPSIILHDKTLGESIFSFDIHSVENIENEEPVLWDQESPYKRYLNTESGISPLAFVPKKNAIIKINSYEHDEFGITTEDPLQTKIMQDKRLRKEKYLVMELDTYKTVGIYGTEDSGTAIICWGSNKGVCVEFAQKSNLKVIQPLVLSPFPVTQFKDALKGVKKIVCVENNATGQLARLLNCHGFKIDAKILKYDGRPFSLDELENDFNNISL